jgi:hypothetical protein
MKSYSLRERLLISTKGGPVDRKEHVWEHKLSSYHYGREFHGKKTEDKVPESLSEMIR